MLLSGALGVSAFTLASPVQADDAASATAHSDESVADPGTPDPDARGRIAARRAGNSARAYARRSPIRMRMAPGDKLIQQGTYAGGNGVYANAFERTHRGLPVVGGDLVVVTNAAGEVLNTTVAQRRPVSIATITPTVTKRRALAITKARLAKVDEVTQQPKLVIWQPESGATRLAWQSRVLGTRAGRPSNLTVYVDAQRGKFLAQQDVVVAGQGNTFFNGPKPTTFATTKNMLGYAMVDPQSKTLSCQNNQFFNQVFGGPDDNWGNGDPRNLETACADAMTSAGYLKGMLRDWLGRDGLDGNNGWVPIQMGFRDMNAYYTGKVVLIGFNNGSQRRWMANMDVVAHELGHAIDHKTPGGQSQGGTVEFVADVFGALTEQYANQPADFDEPDYIVGEDVNMMGSGPIRYMYDPSLKGDAGCYSSVTPTEQVHSASGVGNHWFYLLAEGNNPTNGPASPTCNDSVIPGIGAKKAGQIFMNAMLMKTSASSYPAYRTWTLTAAKNLFPGSCTEFNTVKAAWNAVSVSAEAAEPTCG